MTVTVYRITKERYRDQVFAGLGGNYAYGRWTPRGYPVVYTSQSISLAVLEYALNYKRHGWLPASVLARAMLPDEVNVQSVAVSELPENWRDPDAPITLREIGEHWLRTSKTLCLRVPSAIVPEESNYLLNPAHPDFHKLIISTTEPSISTVVSRAREKALDAAV